MQEKQPDVLNGRTCGQEFRITEAEIRHRRVMQ